MKAKGTISVFGVSLCKRKDIIIRFFVCLQEKLQAMLKEYNSGFFQIDDLENGICFELDQIINVLSKIYEFDNITSTSYVNCLKLFFDNIFKALKIVVEGENKECDAMFKLLHLYINLAHVEQCITDKKAKNLMEDYNSS